ncbi:hypothetical protein LTR08_002465 [Meristemomyces frigidus]|nr:hypothetical protein LTR08_002465 [Meristemomyces frigidus]
MAREGAELVCDGMKVSDRQRLIDFNAGSTTNDPDLQTNTIGAHENINGGESPAAAGGVRKKIYVNGICY